MTIKLAFFGNAICNKKNPAVDVVIQPFGDLLVQHYGPALDVVHWGTPGLSSLLEVRDLVLNTPIIYDMAVVFHHYQSNFCSLESFHKAQKQVYKHFSRTRRPVLHCLDTIVENMPVSYGDVTMEILKMQRLTTKTRNYRDLEDSVNYIDQVGNWRAAKIIESFIEQNRTY